VSDPALVLDVMDESDARSALARCCGASRWVESVLSERPFRTRDRLMNIAQRAWGSMSEADILEAFTHHPRIGADLDKLREKFASTSTWSSGEQAGVASADEKVLRALRDGNIAYETRYGFIFIVCATGKSAAEMLAILEARMHNDRADELRIAAGEQAKIIEIRLDKLGDNA
jgi:2-oxo-4-hydroxy-4-carboxy-5-ureidoimidazoline decarboxylase